MSTSSESDLPRGRPSKLKDYIIIAKPKPDDGPVIRCVGVGKTQLNVWHTRNGLFVKPNPESRFSDRELATLTDRINELWNATQTNNRDPERALTVLVTEQGLVITWSSTTTVNSDDNTPEEVARALGL